jgi:hypothetical protein
MAGGRDESDITEFDALLREARDDAVPEALMARVLADAAGLQAERVPPVPLRPAMRPRVPSGGHGVLRRMIRAAGGGIAVGGLATAALSGLWFGLTQPATLAPVSQHLWPDEAGTTVELIPSLEEVLSYAEG